MSQFAVRFDEGMPVSMDLGGRLHGHIHLKQSRQPIRVNRLHVFHFVTLHTHSRQPLLASTQAKELLLSKLRYIKEQFNLDIAGYVVLDDHFHFLCATRCNIEIGTAVELLRDGFAKEWRRLQPGGDSSELELAAPVWKPDIFSNRLALVDELHSHLNFIHYDPVRHGYVERASDYVWSSLPARVEQGHYPEDWAIHATPAGVAKVARALHLAI